MTGATDPVEKVANGVKGLDLKKNRLLAESTHNYEGYSLPPSRSTSREPVSSGASMREATPNTTNDHSWSASPGSSPMTSPRHVGATFYQPDSHSPENRSPSISRLGSHENDNSHNESQTHPERKYPTSFSIYPAGEADDPYSRKNRPPQNKDLTSISPRFVFSRKMLANKSGSSNSLSSLAMHGNGNGQGSGPSSPTEKSHRSSLFGSRRKDKHHDDHDDERIRKSGSKLELKRFFRPTLHGHRSPSNPSRKPSRLVVGQSASRQPSPNSVTLSHADSHSSSYTGVPFMEESFRKYGKIGRVLGKGAGGSVRIMKRASDNTIFAVKEFRPRHPHESERSYAKKVTAEFCIGSTLHHCNVIETLDIIKESGKYYEVMEYCPYDFFAIVMTGKMSRAEIGCCFKQILSGVAYLHDMGLAHRDLKLDNCVMTEQGILKIIDFGSATVFKYPFENGIVMAKGVVGSDPYLAPEVLSGRKYNPCPTDVWSLAIIFCCMTLRRFPWKAPSSSDNSYRLFVSEPDHAISEYPPDTPSSQIKGPWRLLRLLPSASRPIISRILTVDVEKRAKIKEIQEDLWVQSLQMCTITADGEFKKSTDHEHTFTPEEEVANEGLESGNRGRQ